MSRFEEDERLYNQITARLRGPIVRQEGISGIECIKLDLAEMIVTKFPTLGQANKKWALLMAVDIRFDEIHSAIIRNEHEIKQTNAEEERIKTRICEELMDLGVIRDTRDDLPF